MSPVNMWQVSLTLWLISSITGYSRKSAKKKTQYNSNKTQNDLSRLFQKHFGNDPYDWQIDVSEAMILRLDAIVIAGTGSEKTMPFMMPLLIDTSKKVSFAFQHSS